MKLKRSPQFGNSKTRIWGSPKRQTPNILIIFLCFMQFINSISLFCFSISFSHKSSLFNVWKYQFLDQYTINSNICRIMQHSLTTNEAEVMLRCKFINRNFWFNYGGTLKLSYLRNTQKSHQIAENSTNTRTESMYEPGHKQKRNKILKWL